MSLPNFWRHCLIVVLPFIFFEYEENEKMNAKAYLEELKHSDITINRKLEELERLKCLSQKMTAVYSDMPKSGNSPRSKVEEMVVRIIDLSDKINNEIDRFVDMKIEVSRMINKIDKPEYRNILFMRYVCGKTFEAIAVELNCTYQWSCTLHGRAVREFEVVYDERK